MCHTVLSTSSRRTSTGLADARMLVRALSVQMMPALAIEIVCCSITCRDDVAHRPNGLAASHHSDVVRHRHHAVRTQAAAPSSPLPSSPTHRTSCSTARVESDILSNSSMQQTTVTT